MKFPDAWSQQRKSLNLGKPVDCCCQYYQVQWGDMWVSLFLEMLSKDPGSFHTLETRSSASTALGQGPLHYNLRQLGTLKWMPHILQISWHIWKAGSWGHKVHFEKKLSLQGSSLHRIIQGWLGCVCGHPQWTSLHILGYSITYKNHMGKRQSKGH